MVAAGPKASRQAPGSGWNGTRGQIVCANYVLLCITCANLEMPAHKRAALNKARAAAAKAADQA